jgi:hypothetical protein
MIVMTDMPADRQVLDKDAQLQNPLYLMSGLFSFVCLQYLDSKLSDK